DKAPLEVSMATVSGGEVEQKFILLVRKDKGIKRLSQLKGKKLLVETGGRGDIGLLWLNTTLLKDRLPESGELFSNIKRATKASQAVLPVFFGQADACIVTRGSFRTAAELNPQLGGELDVLAESPPYLVSVACFREGYDEKYKKIIMDTSLKLHEDPKGKQILTLFRVDKIVLFDPTYFNSIKELINEYNELKGSR
ncbi:MAG: PhnD/SsuA/transferrin family substrate-binding protein, partial [Candidatus Omnitrophota bacterium]